MVCLQIDLQASSVKAMHGHMYIEEHNANICKIRISRLVFPKHHTQEYIDRDHNLDIDIMFFCLQYSIC